VTGTALLEDNETGTHYRIKFENSNLWSIFKCNIFLQEKAVEATKQKEEKRKKPKPVEHEGMRHSISTALLKSVAERGTHSAMKSSKKTLDEFTSHIPPKTPNMNICGSTNEMLHTDITLRAQGARVSNTHAREATNVHQNSQAINQLSRHRRQPAPILDGEGIEVINRVNRRRTKQRGSAEVRIKFATLSSQCKAAREWETSTYTKNNGARASTCNCHINNKMTVRSHEV
jgi:hypothetical protein